MDDLRSEIRAAFQKEQTLNPSSPDLRHNIVNLILALLVAIVVVGAIAALVFASGAYPTAR